MSPWKNYRRLRAFERSVREAADKEVQAALRLIAEERLAQRFSKQKLVAEAYAAVGRQLVIAAEMVQKRRAMTGLEPMPFLKLLQQAVDTCEAEALMIKEGDE